MESTASAMEAPKVSAFHKSLDQFLDSGEFSDFTIICGERKFAVHKVIVFAQSKVLRALCSSVSMEFKTNTIDLTQDGLHLVERMIKYFYMDFYAALPADDTPLSRLTLHIEMYSLADKYDVPGLEARAMAYFKQTLDTARSPADYMPCAGLIYESTPETNTRLRNLITGHVVECYMTEKWERSDPLLKAAFMEAPAFGWDCFLRLQKGPKDPWNAGWRRPGQPNW